MSVVIPSPEPGLPAGGLAPLQYDAGSRLRVGPVDGVYRTTVTAHAALPTELHAVLPHSLAVFHFERPGRADDIAYLAGHTNALILIYLDVLFCLGGDLVFALKELADLRSA